MRILKKYKTRIEHGREMGYYTEQLVLILTIEHLKSTYGKHKDEEYYNLERIIDVDLLIEELMETERQQRHLEQEKESKKIALKFELNQNEEELNKLD